MKNLIYFSTFFFLLHSCKKDSKVCESYTELKGHDHIVDINILQNSAEIYDTLAKYELQVWQVKNENNIFGFKSYVFHQGLQVFNEDYYLYKYPAGNILEIGKPALDSITFSLVPDITHRTAINLAKKNMNFDKTCISYRLGIYNTNSNISNSSKNHKLVWKIQGENGWPFVILDANTGILYSKDDGIRI